MNSEAVQAWLRVRRDLLSMEATFTDLAISVANGIATEEELRRARQLLEAHRALCSAAYERAFPPSPPPFS